MKDATKQALMAVIENEVAAQVSKLKALTGQDPTDVTVSLVMNTRLSYKNKKGDKPVQSSSNDMVAKVTAVGTDDEAADLVSNGGAVR